MSRNTVVAGASAAGIVLSVCLKYLGGAAGSAAADVPLLLVLPREPLSWATASTMRRR